MQKPAEKRPLGRPRRGWKNNIKVTPIVCLRASTNGVLFKILINFLFVKKDVGNFLISWVTISFSRTLPHGVS